MSGLEGFVARWTTLACAPHRPARESWARLSCITEFVERKRDEPLRRSAQRLSVDPHPETWLSLSTHTSLNDLTGRQRRLARDEKTRIRSVKEDVILQRGQDHGCGVWCGSVYQVSGLRLVTRRGIHRIWGMVISRNGNLIRKRLWDAC